MKYFYFICILLISNRFFAQEIINVHFEQNIKKVNIYYDLIDPLNSNFFIQIYLSKDNGRNWNAPLKYVSGDVGEKQLAGVSKTITWDVLKEKDSLLGNIQFKIVAYKKDKLGFYTDKRDNRKYKWVKIGNQVWMAENLNYKSVRSWHYNNIPEEDYGRLYSWTAAVISCPEGWHLPTDKEWSKLTDYLGGADVAGKKIKTKYGWKPVFLKGSDKSNFSALPSGTRKSNGIYSGKENSSAWWSSNEYQTDYAWSRSLGFDPKEILRSYDNKNNGFSVRCIKN